MDVAGGPVAGSAGAMKAIMDAVHALSGQIQAQAKVNQQQKKVNHELTKQARFSPIMECKTIAR